MSQNDKPNIDQARLVDEWRAALPETLNKTDQAEVHKDEADPLSLFIHIKTAGHSKYSFDFKVTYIDSREIKAELLDVQKGHDHVDESTEIIQTLIEDYVRHLHECAQILQRLTHA